MKIIVYDAKPFEIKIFETYGEKYEFKFIKENLTEKNVNKAKGFDAVCAFVNASGNANVFKKLNEYGIDLWLQRSMGHNCINIYDAAKYNMKIYKIDSYSLSSIAEHSVMLMLTLDRKIKIVNKDVNLGDFTIDKLVSRSLNESTVAIIGFGQIGKVIFRIIKGFGAKILVHDDFAKKANHDLSKKMGFEWASLDKVSKESDFVSLSLPLLPSTRHIIGKEYLSNAKKNQIIINVSRGAIIDTTALIEALENKKIGGAGLDVIEKEEGIFFFDRTEGYKNDKLKKLKNMDNVIITPHSAFLTEAAIDEIIRKTIENIDFYKKGNKSRLLNLK